MKERFWDDAGDYSNKMEVDINDTNINYHFDYNEIKVVDFSVTPNGNRHFRDLLIPCTCKNLLVNERLTEDSKSQECNVIEKAVLRMLQVKSQNIRETAEALCLEEDLVLYICELLRKRNIIDKDNKAIKKDTSDPHSKSSSANSNEPPEYSNCKIFIEKVTGKNLVLPYISIANDIEFKQIIRISGETANYAMDTEQKQLVKAIILQSSSAMAENPSIYKVKEVVRICENLAENNGQEEKADNLKKIYASNEILYSNAEDNIYCHVLAEIDRTNGNLIIHNFENNGYFQELSLSFNQDKLLKSFDWYQPFLSSTMASLSSNIQSVQQTDKDQSEVLYAVAQRGLEKLKKASSKEDDRRKIIELQNTVINNLYSAFEYGLKECYFSYNNRVDLEIAGMSSHDYTFLIKQIANKYNIQIDSYLELFQISSYRLRGIDKAAPDLNTFLYLLLLQMSGVNNHVMRALLAEEPMMLFIVQRLRRDRNAASHGTESLKIDIQQLESYRESILKYLKFLKPDFKVEGMESSSEKFNDVEGLNYTAVIELRELLGGDFIKSINYSLRDALINILRNFYIAKACLENDAEYRQNASLVVSTSYKILENLFTEICSKNKLSHTVASIYKKEKISSYLTGGENGLKKDDELSNNVKSIFSPVRNITLLSAKETGIQKCLTGGVYSLQAAFIAFLICAPKHGQSQLKQCCRNINLSLPDFIAKIVELRGHNNDGCNVDKPELENIKNSTICLTKTLMEIF